MTNAIDWEGAVKADFPYRENRIYLNSAGAGLSWSGQPAAAAYYYTELAELGSDAQPRWVKRAEETRERAASLLGAATEDVLFLRNTSDVINLAANSVRWQPGDEVVVAADDFPSVIWPWQVAEAHGGRVIRVPVPQEEQREELLISQLTPRTRALAVTHVNAVTGTRVDLERLGRACREVGAVLVVDGIEALGAVDVDLSYVDVYGAAVFKWLLSGFGTSIAYFGQRARDLLEPAFRGYRNVPPSTSFEYSDPNYPGIYVLGPTLEYLENLGWSAIYDRVSALTARVADVVAEAGLQAETPRDARAGIVSVRMSDPDAIVAQLQQRGVDLVQRVGRLRISPHFYNTAAEIDEFAQALRDSLRAAPEAAAQP